MMMLDLDTRMTTIMVTNTDSCTRVFVQEAVAFGKVTIWKRGGRLMRSGLPSRLNRLVRGTFEKRPFHGSKPLSLGRLVRVASRSLGVTSWA